MALQSPAVAAAAGVPIEEALAVGPGAAALWSVLAEAGQMTSQWYHLSHWNRCPSSSSAMALWAIIMAEIKVLILVKLCHRSVLQFFLMD